MLKAPERVLPRMPVPSPRVKVRGVTVKLDADTGRYSSGVGRVPAGEREIRAGEGADAPLLGAVQVHLDGSVTGLVYGASGQRAWHLAPVELWKLIEAADRAWLHLHAPVRDRDEEKGENR